jgi:high-affinity iron transporter
MGQALFIVWRESIEALLVVGILYAWLQRQPDNRLALRHLGAGVALGLGAAALLGGVMLLAGDWLNGSSGEWFQAGMTLCASLLILHMLAWMAKHGRSLRGELEGQAKAALREGRYLGLMLLAALAIAREGSETVIFLYGIGARGDASGLIIGGLLGLALGLLCFYLLQRGSRALGWQLFFRVSEVLLLLLGSAMLMAALDRASGQLMALELPDYAYGVLGDALWDSSALLDDGSRAGMLIASLTGYRAMPSAFAVGGMALYWSLAWWLLRAPRRASALRQAHA